MPFWGRRAVDDSPHPKETLPDVGLIEILSEPRSLVRLAIIGALVLGIIGSFAYVRVATA